MKGFIDKMGGWANFVRNLTPKRQKALKEAVARQRAIDEFVDQYLLPDMLEKGFGFGRAATAEYIRGLGISTFGELDNLSEDEIVNLSNARGVGRKVFIGFLGYLGKRGAPCVGHPIIAEPVTIGVDPASPGGDHAAVATVVDGNVVSIDVVTPQPEPDGDPK